MRLVTKLVMMMILAFTGAGTALADGAMIEDFNSQPGSRWRFFADTVMGGVSSGEVRFLTEGGQNYAHMTGRVSTRNGGGFIQMQTDLAVASPDNTVGVRLIVRGNEQRYFAHLRTKGAVLPWQYHQAGFNVTRNWTEVRLPFTAFEASSALLRDMPRPGNLKTVGIVAYGRDHDAEIDVREVGFY